MVKGRQGERVRLYVRGTVLGYKRVSLAAANPNEEHVTRKSDDRHESGTVRDLRGKATCTDEYADFRESGSEKAVRDVKGKAQCTRDDDDDDDDDLIPMTKYAAANPKRRVSIEKITREENPRCNWSF